MPSKSKVQQRAAGMALAAKRGEIPVSALKGAALSMYRSMTIKELEEFARTKRKRLPRRIRRRGRPRTDAERRRRHKRLYGTTNLPPRGTGLAVEQYLRQRRQGM